MEENDEIFEDLLTAEDAAFGIDESPAELPKPVVGAPVVEPPSVTPELQDALADFGDEINSSTRYSQAQIRLARDVLTRLYAVRRAARFYPMEHPAVREGVVALADAAQSFHVDGVDVEMSFFDGEILLGEQLLAEESVLFDQLIRDMTGIGVGSLIVGRGVQISELEAAVSILSQDAAAIDAAGGLSKLVETSAMPHVDIGAVRAVERVGNTDGDPVEEARASYGGAISLMREIDRLMRANRHVSTSKVKGVVRSLVDNVLSNRYAMLQLTGLKNYDEYTFYHSANVALLSLALGSLITTDYRFLSSLGVGALLHDIGKLSVDLEILNKPGALAPDEWARVRLHPVHGAEVVAQLPGVDKAAIVTILEHHMRYDCSGYPAREPLRKQHLASRIVAVADSYDAMTSQRSYSAARVQDEAMALMVKSAGSSLDPALVRLFVRLLGVYPPRSVVRIGQGEVAIVLQPSAYDPLRPVVRIIATPAGDIMEPVDLDLATAPEITIQGCIDPALLNIDVDSYI